MKQVKRISVFLASPSDVSLERSAVRSICGQLSKTWGSFADFVIDVVGWDTDAHPAFGKEPQAIVNEQIADMSEYDLFVGVMWNRFGSPTKHYGSGTEEEFELAAGSHARIGRPEIMLYFRRDPGIPDPTNDPQFDKVRSFQTRLSRALYWSYANPSDFADQFRTHLMVWLGRRFQVQREAPILVTERVSLPKRYVFLGGTFYEVGTAKERGKNIELAVPANDSTVDESLRRLGRERQELPFAYGNVAGQGRISEAESVNTADGMVWTLKIEVRLETSVYSEMSFNGLSSDEAAEMRARFILLGERPKVSDQFTEQFITQGFEQSRPGGGLTAQVLYDSVGKDCIRFTEQVRLLFLYQLKTASVIDQLSKLSVTSIGQDRFEVELDGFRPKLYSNVGPKAVHVRDVFDLSPSSIPHKVRERDSTGKRADIAASDLRSSLRSVPDNPRSVPSSTILDFDGGTCAKCGGNIVRSRGKGDATVLRCASCGDATAYY